MAHYSPEDLVERRVSLPNGATFALVLPPGAQHDPVVSEYLSGHQVNDHLVACVAQVLPSPGVVVDLGCHVGTFCVAAAALGHRVVGIDASERHVELVTHSARANALDGIPVVHRAISDRQGVATFGERGLFGAVVTGGKREEDSVEVKADTLPSVLDEVGLTLANVDLIKMDIEGSELLALSGMLGDLASEPKPMILYESNPLTAQRFGYSVEGLRTILEALGYTSYRIEEDGLHAAPATEPQPEAWVDVIALTERHRESLGQEVHDPWTQERLLRRFDFWSTVPHGDCRAHVARTLLANWGTFGETGLAREIIVRLAGDQGPDVQEAMASFRWEELLDEPLWVRRARATAHAARRWLQH